MFKTGLYLFSNDLRLDDNPSLRLAASEMDYLVCLYAQDDTPSSASRQGSVDRSDHRNQFLHESLVSLDSSLQSYGHRLVFRKQPLTDAAAEVIYSHSVTHIYGSFTVGRHLNHQWDALKKEHPTITFQQRHSHTIFKPDDLPFTVDSLPFTFSKFRKQVESILVGFPAPKPKSLPPPPPNLAKEKSV
ncbi:MAG: deoxyribodipyrimidine photo-lyase, partial [Porticoccaceae bacterium]|nr:deoxyribodipyrimidine photo-lyase [Porticoccaceae bacterium]